MTDDTTIIPFHQPGSIIDPLTEIAREASETVLAEDKTLQWSVLR